MLREQEAASPPEGAILTAEQIAQRLQVTVAWVYRHRKQLGGWKADGHVRFTEGGLARALRRMQAADR